MQKEGEASVTAMNEIKILHHPIHDWEDEQRKQDAAETLEKGIVADFDELIELVNIHRAIRTAYKLLEKCK